MSEWDPWRRYEKELERRMWDPFYRYEYERERMSWDPFYRMEKELTDPWYRYEKQRERELWDPIYRFEREQERLREDSWYRELHRIEQGLGIERTADPIYVQEKESGLGTRPNDYVNPECRVYMDVKKERTNEVRRVNESYEFWRRFLDPN